MVWYSFRIAIAVLVVGGIVSLSTNGFTTYTYETARRASVSKTPVALSDWQLQDGAGNYLRLQDLDDEYLFVNFIYTRCPTVCRTLGSRYSQLQDHIDDNAGSSVTLLSVSIDPGFDTPLRLQQYKQRHGGQDDSWRVTRPQNRKTLEQLFENTGIRVIPDSWGGFAHSDSIHIVRNGKLVRILDWNSDELTRLINSSNG